jgi:class I fructose-bisphosphate aldolase
MEAGCNAIASTMGGLALFSRKYAHKIPFVVKLNHNELTYPKKYDQIMFGGVREPGTWELAVGATVYFGSAESDRQIIEVEEHLKRLTVWVW